MKTARGSIYLISKDDKTSPNGHTRLMKIMGICLVHALLLASSGLAEELIFEDRFEGRLGEGWTWLREQPADWCIRGDGLEIHNRPGHAQTVINALLRPAPDRSQGKFAVEVTVTNHKTPIQQYEQAGITWYHDGKPVFKLVKELVDGQLVIIPGRKSMTNQSVQLRIVVEGQSLTAQYRPEGRGEFLTAATANLPPPGNDQVSIQCYHGPAEAEHWIRFDDFRIHKLAP